jgi:hypothetical protein
VDAVEYKPVIVGKKLETIMSYRAICTGITGEMLGGKLESAAIRYLACPTHARKQVFSDVALFLQQNKRASQFWREIGTALQYEEQLCIEKVSKTSLPYSAFVLLRSLSFYIEQATNESKGTRYRPFEGGDGVLCTPECEGTTK